MMSMPAKAKDLQMVASILGFQMYGRRQPCQMEAEALQTVPLMNRVG